MNHYPIYDNEAPAFCFQPGDTANSDAPIDCQICIERLDRRAKEDRTEHYFAAMRLGSILKTETGDKL